MFFAGRNSLLFACSIGVILAGCSLPYESRPWRAPVEPRDASIAPFMELASTQAARVTPLAAQTVQGPATIEDVESAPVWPLSVEEVVQLALQSDYVLRSLGGQIVSQPDTARGAIDPALVQTSAVNGEQAALSQFDAQLRSSLTFTRADRGLKRQILLSNAEAVDTLFASTNSVLEKRGRAGTLFGLRSTLDYDRDNLGIPPNRFASAYDNSLGFEIRHPLARGGGVAFNDIAGPGAQAGQYRGIVIAQINTNLAAHDFRIGLRDHLHDVVLTYWGLYLSYADLDAKKRSFDLASETLQTAKQKRDKGLFDNDQVYQAEERFYAAESAYLNAISGSPSRSITGILGVSGSPLAGVERGVLALERRLRFQLGLPPSDGRLIRPATAPSPAPIEFAWEDALVTAVSRRPELARQAIVVKKRRMELIAAKNFLLPKLDAIAQYRFRGFGDEYFEAGNQDSGAFAELFNGDLQEWVAGVELEWPTGNRIGHEAVRNARLSLARELAILEQQQHQVSHELASVFSEIRRAFRVRASALARAESARKHEEASKRKFEAGLPIEIETVLEAQRLAAEAGSALNAAEVDCEIAILKVNVAKATFLNQCNIAIQHEDVGELPNAWTGRDSATVDSTAVPRVTESPADAVSGSVRSEDLSSMPELTAPIINPLMADRETQFTAEPFVQSVVQSIGQPVAQPVAQKVAQPIAQRTGVSAGSIPMREKGTGPDLPPNPAIQTALEPAKWPLSELGRTIRSDYSKPSIFGAPQNGDSSRQEDSRIRSQGRAGNSASWTAPANW